MIVIIQYITKMIRKTDSSRVIAIITNIRGNRYEIGSTNRQ